MEPDDIDGRDERADTDARLLAERAKTDAELAETKRSVEKDADDVVAVARDRAEVILRDARLRADRDLTRAGAASSVRHSIDVERASEDGAVAGERIVADETLRTEREERQRSVSALLRIEREATDDGLLVERARADEMVSTRDEFLGIVSHDLRAMISGVGLSAGLLAKHATPDAEGVASTLRHAERIKRFSVRMTRLVSDLLDVVSLEAGKLQISPKPDDVIELAQDAVEAFQPSFSAKGVSLTANLTTPSLRATFDHERIFQVLTNLLGNALKFTERGGDVALSVDRSGAEICFSVIDTGVGIPADQTEAIFERFRQVDTKDRRGLGLGLYIAKCIIDAHGGRIWAERPAAGGTALRFAIPVDGVLGAEGTD